MKNLILVRHGKSSWDYVVNDKDRPLLEKGINDGHIVAKAFKRIGIEIDTIYSSPANRALHTCMIFMRNMNFPFDKFGITNELYDFSGNNVLHFIKNLEDSKKTVMVFGHNHAFTHLANTLGNSYIDNVPTSGLVQITFNTKFWASIENGVTSQIIFPKQINQ